MSGNRLTNLLGIRYPILQGAMVWVSDHRLASACSNAGILGTIGTGSMPVHGAAQNINRMRESTRNPFAVNLTLLRKEAPDIGRMAIDMGCDILITSAGNPSTVIPEFKKKGATVIHVVPSVKGARKSEDAGADAVICEGYEAGGHNSPFEITTMALVPQIRDAVKIPVIAAGGIADGRGIAAALALGADGVQMGTRFLATKECPAHDHHKQMIIDAPDTGTMIIGRKLGMLRVLRNPYAEKIDSAEKQGATKEDLLKMVGTDINRSEAASIHGDIENGAFQAGQSSGLITEILSVEELVTKLVDEYEKARKSLFGLD